MTLLHYKHSHPFINNNMQVQLSIQHDFYGYSMFNGWYAKCIVLLRFPISTFRQLQINWKFPLGLIRN